MTGNRDDGTQDIVTRLRRWTHAVDAAPASDLMDEAADEIERLRRKISGGFAVRCIRWLGLSALGGTR